MFRELMCIAIATSLLTACPGEKTETPDSTNNSTSNNTTGTNAAVGGLQILASKSPRVKFKGGERWSRQLARGLELERDELCQELGQYDCARDVHFIALGGVEPYHLRIDDPLPKAPLTAPIAVERIALSACSRRAERDVESPADASLFREISADPSSEDLRAMGSRLYRRLLSRDAEPGELDELEAFWGELEGDEQATEWATLSCFAVASSTEMLFY